MGASQTKPFDQDKDVVYQHLVLAQQEIEKAQLCPHKPLPGYAYLTQKRPAIYPEVQKTLAQQLTKKIFEPPQKKRGVKLPCYILAAMPGCYYQGEWKNGRPLGYGKVYAKNGIYFEGFFEEGLANCQEGILVYADGAFYRGAFKDNSFHGRGVFIYKKNGTKYVGEWQQDKPNGKGAEYYFDQSRYQGEFKDGLKHGEGKYTFSDGKIYKGIFHQGQFLEGRLIQKGSRGNYEGKFNRGFKIGVNLATEFGVYTGAFVNGLMHDPKAVFRWSDGKTYYGPFQFGQMHGEGKIVCLGGQEIVGKWQRGKNIEIISIGLGIK